MQIEKAGAVQIERNSPPSDPHGPGGILKVSALGIEEATGPCQDL
jgi:hypothetical protein